MTTTLTHFTAWLVNDPTCLDTPACDVTILQDQLVGADPDRDGNWSCDSSKPIAFHAVTGVDAKNGDIDQALAEAADLMAAADWRIVGDWDAVDNAYIVTVERDA